MSDDAPSAFKDKKPAPSPEQIIRAGIDEFKLLYVSEKKEFDIYASETQKRYFLLPWKPLANLQRKLEDVEEDGTYYPVLDGGNRTDLYRHLNRNHRTQNLPPF